jgi:hypothetical protein
LAEIRSKRQFYDLWNRGLLGNRLRNWSSPAELERAGFGGLVSVRSQTLNNWAGCRYNLTVPEALELAKTCPSPQFGEMAPDDRLLIQGEAMDSHDGLQLTYSLTPGLRMREAMKKALTARGVVARVILERYLWPSSLEDLRDLWEAYPDAVIEFSAYSVAVGDQRGRNTLIWEVRNY